MKFFADEMLGKLARWLRMTGLDVGYQKEITDESLIFQARGEARTILTRDTRLIRRLEPEEFLFIHSDHLREQFQEFRAHFPDVIQLSLSLSRCVECNTHLQPVAKAEIQGKVWPYVFLTQENFTECPNCRKIYWKATHVGRIEEKLKQLMED